MRQGDLGRASIGRHPVAFVVAAAAAGAGLGAVARIWMRWISVDPEFSWGGTIAILMGFTVFAIGQAAVAVSRIRSSRRALTTAMRVLAVLLSVGLFGAAGAVMLPTVVFGSIAVWRCGHRPAVRLLLGSLATPSVVFVVLEIAGDHGWGVVAIARMLAFVMIYSFVIAATWPTVAPIRDGMAR